MKLTTFILVNSDETSKSVARKANELKDTILSFAALHNYAFWDAETANAENCILVYGSSEGLEEAKQIKCDDIENELMAWCQEVANCLYQVPDEGLQCGSFDVEIKDLGFAGGMHITCCRKDDTPLYVLWVLPIKKEPEQ